MAQNKLIQQPGSLTNEELQDLLNNTESKEEDDNFDNIISDLHSSENCLIFLSNFEVVPGTHQVKSDLLFKLYQTSTKHYVTKKEFEEVLNRYLVHQVYKGQRLYYINQSALKLTKKTYQLLSYTKRNSKIKNPKYKAHIEIFLKKFDIKEGKTWVEGRILYHVYDKWIYKNKATNYLAKHEFLNFLKLFFNYKQLTTNRLWWFQIDESYKNHITEEELKQLDEGFKRKTKHGKEKKEKQA